MDAFPLGFVAVVTSLFGVVIASSVVVTLPGEEGFAVDSGWPVVAPNRRKAV